ncbi:hypothetical protein FK220_010790 [Flavobacteriaceae bacterium TP-CH-4]|uniref:MG2 domain-containing protein n=1 Tax=Pelagihabitans pacificus TaxID=2696054 RepID=A0A967AT67_9FLAO|nr:Ig-like domain-containing protein [Pelagihabitans pacificus]NHF59828.1 hypothetical protein [Pelagihabitans pacificus]
MNKKNVILALLAAASFVTVRAQYVIRSESELESLKKLPLEKMYLHTNTALLFPGEYLYYSLYNINAATNKLSSISRMGYVELVGEDLQTVFKQKVRLKGGRGQGDFFIPVSVPSGNYKLIGYTQWMKNAGLDQVFQQDIAIVNPYRTDQQRVLTGEAVDSISTSEETSLGEDRSILLLTDRDAYGKREMVSLTPRNFRGPLGYGDYSISVRRKGSLNAKNAMRAREFGTKYLQVTKTLPKTVNDSIFLPEQRGELFFGTVVDSNNQPVQDETVILSIPGDDFQLKSAVTDRNGNFYAYIYKPYDASKLLAQTLDGGREDQRIILKRKPSMNYEGLQFGDFTIDRKDEKAILDRSVYNQIENAYYSVKPDSILAINEKDPYDGGTPDVIYLDEYTRFPTLRETLIEVVPNLWVRKLDDGSYSFWVREEQERYEKDFESDPPLVLVDGIFVPNHNSLLEFNARLIEKISILRDPLVLGSKKYLGMVVIETYEGDYLERMGTSKMAQYDLNLPALEKNYFFQSYAPETSGEYQRIPDFRYQLFWMPQFEIGKDTAEQSFEFYTSDVPGEYEIVLEGFTTYGKPISTLTTITVD